MIGRHSSTLLLFLFTVSFLCAVDSKPTWPYPFTNRCNFRWPAVLRKSFRVGVRCFITCWRLEEVRYFEIGYIYKNNPECAYCLYQQRCLTEDEWTAPNSTTP